ncbi:MAG: arylsulfatase [Microthrixaceae bacterium]
MADEQFGGRVERYEADSEPWWPTPPHPGDDAPDVVVILLDDTGFAHLGCFGSDLNTPNLDRLAEGGLRYTNFHATPLCSPSRAALLTGRNHHEVGMRALANFDSGYSHMTGHISRNATTMAEVLSDEGYATFAVGKWHLCPMEQASAAGPFDHWPCQRGFDRFYGFLEGETDQFHPELVADNHMVDPPTTAEEGYHLTEDLVDRASRMIHDTVSVRPDRPFFMYFALGAMHAPHQAPKEYLEKYRGKFDEGWDVARRAWFDRQITMGLLPPETELAPRNPGVEEWDSLPENQKMLAARLQEAFAAFLDHTDAQLGRLIETLDELGRLDNTVIMVLSDNGASQEGGPFGVLHEMKFFNFLVETPDEAVERLDDIGGPHSHSNYPWGWAQAGNAPFKWYKQNTHEGGVHVPLIVHWPDGIGEQGGIRDQFHHINDLAPTIYEVAGVSPPSSYRGVEQTPVSGTSLKYSFDSPDQATRKKVQYFEMMGHRGIYADGWKAVTHHQFGSPFENDVWELYHIDADRSECKDLAADNPEKLAEMIDLWWSEAARNNVLPLDDRTIELFGARFREHSPHPTDRRYVLRPPMTRLPAQVSPAIGGRSWALRASMTRTAGQGGVVYAVGTENSGISLFVANDRLVFDYNCFGDHHVATSERLPAGDQVLGVDFIRDGAGARATLVVMSSDTAGDDDQGEDGPGEDGAGEDGPGSIEIPFAMHIMSSTGASIGEDHGSQVSPLYSGPNTFDGKLDSVEIQLLSRSAPDGASALSRSEFSRQ